MNVERFWGKDNAEAQSCQRGAEKSDERYTGTHTRDDGKSAQAIDGKGVAMAPLRKRVRKNLKRKGIVGEHICDDGRNILEPFVSRPTTPGNNAKA